MGQTQPGLLKTSLRFVRTALNENALLRTSVLATALFVTLACITLAALGITSPAPGKGVSGAYSPRLFALLFLPAEFLIYDLILGNRKPRTTLKDLYLDWRFPQLLWEWLKLIVAVALPLIAFSLLIAFASGLLKAFAAGTPSKAPLVVILLVVGFLILALAMLSYIFRFLYLPLVVARRQPQALKTAFRETKGKVWEISCALFLPYLAILAVTIPVELLGPLLERNLGFVGLAPWFLFDACLTGFVCCLTAAVFAFSYQRIIGTGRAAGDSGPEFAFGPGGTPQDGGTGGAD